MENCDNAATVVTESNATPIKQKGWWGAMWIPSLYFAEGLPYIAVMTISVIMYKCLGVSNSAIAFFTSLLYLPWVLKPLWSPFVDIIRTKRWWILTMQATIAILFGLIAISIPTPIYLALTLFILLLLAFASATHDIAADGFYMLGLTQHEQSMWVGIRSLAYRIASVAGQGGLVVLAYYIGKRYDTVSGGWIAIFALMSAFFALIAMYHAIVLPRPKSARAKSPKTFTAIMGEFADTIITFFTKPGVIGALVFMLFYRLPEALIIKMIPPFLLDTPEAGGMGLDAGAVGLVYGTSGVIGLICGGIIGGIVAGLGGLRRWLRPMAWSMSLSCLTFLYLAWVQPTEMWQIYLCVTVEQLGYGFGFTAYMLYLLYFAAGQFETAHYSFCTGFMALGMMFPGLIAGWLADAVGYLSFFIICIICCIATIGVCYLVNVPAEFGKKQK